jgi:hypothetical protein
VEQAGQQEQVIAAKTLARQHEIQLAFSNPSFEVWPLAHFVSTTKSFAGCDKVIEELNKHWRREFKQDYEKNDEDLYRHLADRTQKALDNARTVREQHWASSSDIVSCNSATDVYRLVRRLLSCS